MRRALPILAAVVIAALVVVGLTQTGGGADESAAPASPAGSFDLARARERLRGAPAPLAALHEQANELLEGGRKAFTDRIGELKGHPVVVNKWASWCGPCRAEFPFFQSVATERGKSVAFVGVNSRDVRAAAAGFLEQFPVPYPSYEDPDEAIARALKVPANFPVTVFVDARGRTAFIHQGGYTSKGDLTADIDRYLG